MKQVNELKTMIANQLYDKNYDELDETTSNDVETLAYRLIKKQTNNKKDARKHGGMNGGGY